MNSPKKYPKVPTAINQVLTTIVIIVLCVVAFIFINPELKVSLETKRVLVRASCAFVLAGSILGSFGLIWSQKNSKKLTLAKIHFDQSTEAIRRMTHKGQNANKVSSVVHQATEMKEKAAVAVVEATDFGKTVTIVGMSALGFITVGVILQAVIA